MRVPTPVELACADPDDIQFVSSGGATNAEYFQNIDKHGAKAWNLGWTGGWARSR
jgi:hypothetical protein